MVAAGGVGVQAGRKYELAGSIAQVGRHNLFAGRRQIGVEITVTDERLVFVPNRLDRVFGGRRIEIARDGIDEVRTEPASSETARRRGLSARVRPQVEIRSGDQVWAVTVDRPSDLTSSLKLSV